MRQKKENPQRGRKVRRGVDAMIKPWRREDTAASDWAGNNGCARRGETDRSSPFLVPEEDDDETGGGCCCLVPFLAFAGTSRRNRNSQRARPFVCTDTRPFRDGAHETQLTYSIRLAPASTAGPVRQI